MAELVDGQKQLESKFETMVDNKKQLTGTTKSTLEKKAMLQQNVSQLGGDLRNSTHVFSRSVKQSPLTADNLEKVQADR